MTRALTKADLLRRIRGVLDNIEANINRGAGDKVASGLSSEGYAGGYRQAILDVDALLRHGSPSDPRRYWRPTPVTTEGGGENG